MTLGRQIFESTVGKILLPWVNLGFTGALCALAAELYDAMRATLHS